MEEPYCHQILGADEATLRKGSGGGAVSRPLVSLLFGSLHVPASFVFPETSIICCRAISWKSMSFMDEHALKTKPVLLKFRSSKWLIGFTVFVAAFNVS